jgi:acyl carrier protein
MTDLRSILRSFVVDEFLQGEDPQVLTPETELISSGVLDSLALIKLTAFLERTFRVKLAASEVTQLETLASMERLVRERMA